MIWPHWHPPLPCGRDKSPWRWIPQRSATAGSCNSRSQSLRERLPAACLRTRSFRAKQASLATGEAWYSRSSPSSRASDESSQDPGLSRRESLRREVRERPTYQPTGAVPDAISPRTRRHPIWPEALCPVVQKVRKWKVAVRVLCHLCPKQPLILVATGQQLSFPGLLFLALPRRQELTLPAIPQAQKDA